MSSSKAAMMVRRTPDRPRRGGAPSSQPLRVEEFAAQGRRFRWREGASMALVRSDSVLTAGTKRGALAGLFTRTVVPQLERRGARGVVFAAAPPANVTTADVRWVAWRAPEEQHPVWGLYLAARALGPTPDAPANDAFVLVAWGDGPVLAWADERELSRAALRAALHVPPPWLVRGMRSADTSFPVRIDKLAGRDPDPAAPPAPCLTLPPAATAAPSARAERAPDAATSASEPTAVATPVASAVASPRALLDAVKAWKREHPPAAPAEDDAGSTAETAPATDASEHDADDLGSGER